MKQPRPRAREEEVIQVEVRSDAKGRVRPRAFTWRSSRRVITSLGRTWLEGDERHYLVLVAQDRAYELAESPEGWRLIRRPEDFGPSHKRHTV